MRKTVSLAGFASIVALIAPSTAVSAATAAPPSAAIEVFQTVSTFTAATRVKQMISFDDLATGTSLGNPASFGSVDFRHSTAATFKTIGSPAYVPESPPNVLAPFALDNTLEFGDTTLTFAKRTRAAGLFLVLPAGSNETAIWTTTVTATDIKSQSVTVTVTFQGVVGEQQFIGFKSHRPLAAISFGYAGSEHGSSAVIAMDDITVG